MWSSSKEFEIFKSLTKIHGLLVRISPHGLMTDGPELIRCMSRAKSQYGKYGWYEGNWFNPYHSAMFNTRDTISHDKLKAKLSAGHTGRDIPTFESDIDLQLIELVKLIRNNLLLD